MSAFVWIYVGSDRKERDDEFFGSEKMFILKKSTVSLR